MAKKRAWNSSNPLYRWMHRRKSHSTTRGKSKVARKRKRSFGRRSGSGMGKWGWLLGALGYGAVREYASNKLAPITARIPLGNISDEAALIATAYIAKRFVGRKVPLVADVANAAMVIELARIGEAGVKGQIGLGSSSSSVSSNTVVA